MNDRTDWNLDAIGIASPCTADWNAMQGDERRRFCGECKLNVYNLSGMSRSEADALIRAHEGRLCVRFHRRADGTVLTRDCPVGWRAIRHRARAAWARCAALAGVLLGGGALSGCGEKKKAEPLPPATRELMGEVCAPADAGTPAMGKVRPAPTSTPTSNDAQPADSRR